MNKYVKIALKATITVSSMLAMNDIVGYFAPTRSSQTIHRIGNNIAGMSIGYLVGLYAADAAVENLDKAIAAYKGEEIDG